MPEYTYHYKVSLLGTPLMLQNAGILPSYNFHLAGL